jgi:hypothetical protein
MCIKEVKNVGNGAEPKNNNLKKKTTAKKKS